MAVCMTVYVAIFSDTTQAVVQSTSVCGTIATNSTWLLSNSPYLVCNTGITVSADAALTIEPGVEVQVAPDGRINVQGALIAAGTATQPITITGVSKSAGSWQGLNVSGSSTATATAQLNHVVLEYGGIDNSYGGQVYAETAWVTITNSVVRNGIRAGLFGWSKGRILASDTRFENNAGAAISLIYVADYDLTMPNLVAIGNGLNAIQINSTNYIKGNHTWNNAGIPFVLDAPVGNLAGDVWTIAPGSELQFTETGWLNIGGTLHAVGLPGQPITFTGTLKTPGAWRGITVSGTAQQRAKANLDYATIEYAGLSNGNIYLSSGNVHINHSIIRHSAGDGVTVFSNSPGNVIQNSQIISNAGFGIKTTDPTRLVLAPNNWWGHPSGPTSEAGCGTGSGSRISAGVIFQPVRSDLLTIPPPLALSDARILSVTARRWFVPADGQSRAYFDITLRDGNGAAISGRKVRLLSNVGNVTDGGITDINGKTLGYVVATQVGDAEIYAALDNTGCQPATTPYSKITFTQPLSLLDLSPESPAPYLDTSLDVTPMPIVQGVTTTLRATFTNPLTQPVTIDVSFEFVQSSIGLAFGPLATVTGKVIPAKGTLTVATEWVPTVSGHICVQAQYSIVGVLIDLQGRQVRQSQAAGFKQKNLNVYQGGKMPPSDKDSLNKADKAFNLVNKIPGGGTPIHKAMVGGWWNAVKNKVTQMSKDLGGDPPRQDFQILTPPQRPPVSLVQPDTQISAARAAAINAVTDSLADVIANGQAAVIALDRAGGASEAGDLQWASLQTGAQIEYQRLLGAALITTALRIDALVQVAASEGVTTELLTAGEILAYQQALTTTGFSAEEIAGYRLFGMSDAEIEAEKQAILALKPAEAALDLVQSLKDWANAYRELGDALLHPRVFEPSFSVSGGGGLAQSSQIAAPDTGNTMAQVYGTTGTFVLGNPLSQTATIELRQRLLGMPADWLVTITPDQITLTAGAQTTVTVTIVPGVPVPQGSNARLAIEGYANNQLLGGVVMDVLVPAYVFFDGKQRVYLPSVNR